MREVSISELQNPSAGIEGPSGGANAEI